ncbi:hypothetical protein R2325_05870 [Mycobacteroides chelonae]|nr:hypothetical protein [Mycobacteroides chelonae]MEC4855240.1 hypothetical protein [Mycobacteroides chelonae]MEC4855251.1 hypothetical protein [Mycobacteroides chelonae]
MTEPQPGLDGLLRHAKARSADARARIDKAIRDLRRQHAPININAVARAAGVTRKTIYRNPEQLARIRAHNPFAPPPHRPPAPPPGRCPRASWPGCAAN